MSLISGSSEIEDRHLEQIEVVLHGAFIEYSGVVKLRLDPIVVSVFNLHQAEMEFVDGFSFPPPSLNSGAMLGVVSKPLIS